MSTLSVKVVPDGVDDLTIEWFSSILGQPIQDSTFKVTGDSLIGAGFLSTMIRVEFQTEPKDGQTNEETWHKVIVKLLPEMPEIKAACINDRFDQTEILTYRIIIPELIKEIPSIKKYFCDIMYGDIRDSEPHSCVLVLKDLEPEWYSMINVTSNVTNEHFDQGLDFLAQLHAASLSLENKKKSTMLSTYPWFPKLYCPQECDPDPSLFLYFAAGFKTLYEIVSKNPMISPATIKLLIEIECRSSHIYRAVLKAASKFPCMVHGDLWSYNILVQEDVKVPIKIIDWQMIGYTDPTADLTIYILFCIPFELLTVEGVMDAAKKYYNLYGSWLKTLGLDVQRNWEQFELSFEPMD